MKKLLFTLSIFCTIAVFAQSELGAIYMPQLTSLHNKANRQGDPIYKALPTIAYAGGLSFSHHINRTGTHGPIRHGALGSHFKLKKLYRIDVIYAQHNQRFRSEYRPFKDSIATHYGKKRLGYLKIPIMYQATHPINKHFAISFYGGPQLSILMRAKGGVVYWEHFENHDYYDLPFASKKYYNLLTFDVVTGCNMEYRFTQPHLRWYNIVAGIRADWSVSTVENNDVSVNNYPVYGDVYNYDKERKNSRNTTVGLMFGVNYIFHTAEHVRTRF
jgi:hypothetical protein